jgi:hypothetical protein
MRNETLEMLSKIKLEKDILKEQYERNVFDYSINPNNDMNDDRDNERYLFFIFCYYLVCVLLLYMLYFS